MSHIWSDGEKLRRWLEVELAALEGWAEVGTVPHEDVAAIREHVVAADARARGRDRARDEPRRRRLRRRRLRGPRRGGALVPLRAHLVRRARHRALAGRPGRRRARARGARPRVRRRRPPRRGAPGDAVHRPHARRPRRADDVRRSSSPAGRSRSIATASGSCTRSRACASASSRAPSAPTAAAEPEVERVACERLGLEPAPSSTQVLAARPPRRAALGAGAARLVARPLRDRDPPPRAHRGARGRGAVRPRPEGLVGDAAQAQPDHGRAHLRDRAGRAGQLARRARERRPLARARHLALLGRADRPARLVPRRRLHARPVRLARRGPRRPRGADAREPRRRATASYFSQRLLLALVESGSPRDDAYRLVQRNAMRAWDEQIDFRSLVDADPEIAAPGRPRRACSTWARTPPTSMSSSIACARSSRRGGRARMSEHGGATHLASGKVREIYALDDERLLLVASRPHLDVRRDPADADPRQGARAHRACRRSGSRGRATIVPNHLLELGDDGRSTDLPAARDAAAWSSSSAATCPARRWVDYQASGAVCGHALPPGLVESDRLPEPIVTPATKADEGHDLNITEAEAAALCGAEAYEAARDGALGSTRSRRPMPRRAASCSPTRSSSSASIPTASSRSATRRSRPTRRGSGRATRYAPGGPQPSFDKQYVRDYCLATGWDRTDPGPEVPDDVVRARAPATSTRSSG